MGVHLSMEIRASYLEVADRPQSLPLMVNLIKERLWERGETLADAIRQRSLYFRVSILGACNLDCPFCHNEGGPKRGKLDIPFVSRAIRIASDLGFQRVQFTGGEPLMHPRVADFVAAAREIMADVGVTTNGTYLTAKLDSLVKSGLSRIHISLQSEALRIEPNAPRWTIPEWLGPVLDLGRQNVLRVRLNLPVPVSDLQLARSFLVDLSNFECDVNLFSILPQNQANREALSSAGLEQIAAVENARRERSRISGLVFVRGYRPPKGIRCSRCPDKTSCKEQSHSLRLGVDRTLRPCLATRMWDINTTVESLREEIEAASILALDYSWPDKSTTVIHG
jgi:cyclic pyranopterin phosphate synthase